MARESGGEHCSGEQLSGETAQWGLEPMDAQGLDDTGWVWVSLSPPRGLLASQGGEVWNRGCRLDRWARLGLKVQ